MRLHIITFIFLFLNPFFFLAQVPLEPGFEMLEQGAFAEAENFFANILDKTPDNRTAKICYGRAVGLNGKPEKALSIFSTLQQASPNDEEVLLNVSEAYMWSKQYAHAEKRYDQLLAGNPWNFTANLGGANARAAQNKYLDALVLIDQAINIQPDNQNARISKKFILLGIAGQHKSKWEYDQAHHRLDEVEMLFPGDKDARLLRADILLSDQQFRQAQDIYQLMLQDNMEMVRALSGLSYTSILLKKKKEALRFAEMAVQTARQIGADSLQRINAGIQLVNALGVNRRFKEAFSFLDTMELEWGNALPIKMAKARMKVWNKDLQEGGRIYQQQLSKDTESFDLIMGMVEMHRAGQDIDAALQYLQQARQLLPNQPDAFRLWQEMRQADQPALQLNGSLLEDSGGNLGQGLNIRFELGRKGRIHPYFIGSNWQAYGKENPLKAQQNTFLAGTQIQFSSNLKGRVNGGATVFPNADHEQQTAVRGEAGLNFLLGKYHNLDVAVSRDLHNYTADLVQSGIARNNIALTYNFAAPTRLGLYAQYLRTFQSDGNSRNLIFASLYYKVLESPVLKLGLNYNTFGFEREEAEKYFSPSNSTATEAFVQVLSDQSPRKKIFYKAFFALGIQQVALDAPQQTTRMEFSLGFRPTKQVELVASYQAGNTVQASISGYAYQQFGLQLRYAFPLKQENPFQEMR